MRKAAVDANQKDIVQALRGCGASVSPTHTAGQGFPDLTVGYQGKNYLLEVKDGSKPPSQQKLTPAQTKWHATWSGQVTVVRDVDEALAALGIKHRGQIG